MSEGINLLDPNKNRATIVPIRRIESMRLIVAVLLFFVSVTSVILFILVAISPLSELQQQEQSLRLRLSQSKSDIAKLAFVNERTTTIDGVIKKRLSLDETMALIQSKLASNAKITAMRADKDTVTLTVQSRSLQSLNDFLNGLSTFVQEKKGFSQVTMSDLTGDETTREYSVTISLVLL